MYELTKLEKEILKICNLKHPEPTDIDDFEILKSKYSDLDISLACKHLHNRDYFVSAHFAMGDVPISLSLSHLGLSYKERSHLETKELLFKSVAVPIVVSIITTLTVIGIQNLFS